MQQKIKIIPAVLEKEFLRIFADPQQSVYAQIATIDKQDASQKAFPSLRTVHLRYIENLSAFAFNTGTHSRKWQALQAGSNLAGCYHHTPTQTQWRWHGQHELIDAATTAPTHQKLRHELWQAMRHEVRVAYWLAQERLPITRPAPQKNLLAKPTENFGTVLSFPSIWEHYHAMHDQYRQGKRLVCRFTESWQIEELPLVDWSAASSI
jgi:pyridoxine/pyridoxamine 5'-phosphate oxidase